eukprot:Gb_36125 [translate_table: standard]
MEGSVVNDLFIVPREFALKSVMRHGNGTSALAPLMEGPTQELCYSSEVTKKESSWNVVRDWVRATFGYKFTDLKLLLGVLGCPLAPVAVLCNDFFPPIAVKDVPIVVQVSTLKCSCMQILGRSSSNTGVMGRI